jgi:hypothetical protein
VPVFETGSRRFEPVRTGQDLLGCGVIGNTTDFDSVVSGSIPDIPARNASLVQLDRTPAYEAVRLGIRIPRDAPDNVEVSLVVKPRVVIPLSRVRSSYLNPDAEVMELVYVLDSKSRFCGFESHLRYQNKCCFS